jgi:flagellar protein FlgJ
MSSTESLRASAATADAYTDLQSLQKLRTNPDKDAALRQVAQQFESMFLNLLLKNMREANAVFEEDSLFNSNESRMVRDMYDNQLSLSMAHANGTGLADALYRQMSGRYGTPAADSVGAGQENGTHRAANAQSPVSGAQSGQPAGQRVAIAADPEAFLQELWPHAKAAAEKLGLDPEVLLAQAALETGWGKHVLADQQGNSSNNYFNIKASADWTGDTVPLNALEFRDGIAVREQSQFKKYDSAEESFADFVATVQSRPRYARAVEQAPEAEAFISALQDAGYATDPQYAGKVMAVYKDLTGDRYSTNSTTANYSSTSSHKG